MIGENVSHYKILEKLGEGGMGEVYLAQDTRLGRKVALKFLPASYQYDPDRRERFLREARAASALRSPNVAAIYDIGEEENMMFMAMEHVEGELLSNKLEQGPMDIYPAIGIAIQVAEALDEAHTLGIVHRDIKSSNLMITARGVVKVLDFGLAKMSSSQPDDKTVPLGKETAPGVILGTLSYMSPEQARGLDVDGRSDLFSLGVLLYEMLTGRQPFEGGTTGDLLVSILSSEPLPLAHIIPDAPAQMQWIVSKALHKDRELRYQTARDLIVDLRNLTHGLDTRVLSPVIERESNGHAVEQAPHREIAKKDSRVRRRKQVDSIAVLPLVNASGNAEIEYLSDGITESLINALSRIPKLRVMARSTVFRYKGRDNDPQHIGIELNVRAVMIGRIRQMGDQFLIGAELVDVNDGSQLWGEQYAKRMSGILTLQDEISGDIGEKLKLKLTSGEKRNLAKRHTNDAEAYRLYLKGRYHGSKWTREGFREAIACFEQALGKDPGFALAYAGLGFAYGAQSYFSADPAQSQGAILKSKACAKRALEIDDALAEAHLALANIAHLNDWDWTMAEREFKIALELNSNLAEAHLGYSLFLMDQRRFEEAMAEMGLALRLDPLSLPVNTASGFLLFNAGRYEEAISQLKKALAIDPAFQLSEFDPSFSLSHQLLGASLERAQRHDEAMTEYLRMIPEWAGKEEMVSVLKEAYAQLGMRGFWRRFVPFAQELSERRTVTPLFVAGIYASLGDKDSAFEWIERAFSEQTPAMSHIKVDPRFENLHTDSRFPELLRRMGLN